MEESLILKLGQLELNRDMKTKEEEAIFTHIFYMVERELINSPEQFTACVCKCLSDNTNSYNTTYMVSGYIRNAHKDKEVIYRQFIKEIPQMQMYALQWIEHIIFYTINKISRFNGFKEVLENLSEEDKYPLLDILENMKNKYEINFRKRVSIKELENIIFNLHDIDLDVVKTNLLANIEQRSEEQKRTYEDTLIEIFGINRGKNKIIEKLINDIHMQFPKHIHTLNLVNILQEEMTSRI